MGQSSSRYHPQPNSNIPANTNAVAGASTDPQPVPPIDVNRIHTDPARPRPSVRNRILKLVKPSNIRNRLSGAPTLPTDTRRSWRRSRRWSQAPIDAVTGPRESLPVASSSTSLTAGRSELSSSYVGKGKEKEKDISLDDADDSNDVIVHELDEAVPSSCPPALHDHPSSTTITPEASHVAELEVEAQPTIADQPFSEADESDSDPTPIYQWEGTEPIPAPPSVPANPLPTPVTQTTPAFQPRQFPPPGTLVVVQGIVHTTDVSRNSTQPSPSNPQSDGTGSATTTPSGHPTPSADLAQENRARNRLSTLLRRAASVGAPITLLDSENLPASPSGSQTPPEDSTITGLPITPPTNEADDSPLENLPEASSPSPPIPPPVPENRAPAISSSSIDVLGTLLSVAAAATAASLLTGSSEPILSSGLAPPNQVPLSNAEPILGSSSSPSLPSYPRPATPIPDVSAAGRADRMRHAWGTIRERLGLRPSTTPPPSIVPRTALQQDGNVDIPPNPFNGDSNQSSPSPDTRELMLAEMARAFNIGLGLNGLGGLTSPSNNISQSTQTSADAAADLDGSSERNEPVAENSANNSSPRSQSAIPPSSNLPPEGSFERFLVDLQNDLRTALTQPEDETNATRTHSNVSQTQAEPQPLTSGPSTTNGFLPSTPNMTPQQPPPRNDENHLELADHMPEAAHDDEDTYSEMPFLEAVSDSESEFDDAENNNYEEDEDESHPAQHAFGPSQAQSQHEPSDEQHSPSEETNRIDASGRINWWRLYRFPPILSPRIDVTGARAPSQSTTDPLSPSASTASPENSSSPAPNLNSSAQLPQASASPPSSSAPSQPIGEVPPTQTPLHSVIPVIVVGLQSVNQEWRPDIPPQGDEGIDLFGQPPSDEMHHNHGPNEHGDDGDYVGQPPTTPGVDGGRGRGRGRGWHSRAANAIRNLRPGRRAAETTTGFPLPIIAPGSRTFLIYVIGGYYPPDHNIVTGGANILDSFEALLELADLLGQVKPPTVSKEDIDKSGLEIIKAAQLDQYEKDGKVSSNCLERCLICLDDYEPEDPIRVMSCRHAFHKSCVDEWLQRGRNNCPACRSTGVAADSNPTTIPSPTS